MTVNLHNNFTEIIEDLRKELVEKEQSILDLNLKHRLAQDLLDQYQLNRFEMKKEIFSFISTINEILNKKGLDKFKIDITESQRNNNLDCLQILNTAIKNLKDKL
jgi:hypothetical protein